jgi:hypothetical protein
VMTIMGASLVFAMATGRDMKVGTPRLWGTLALGAATTSALTALWITGADLLRDHREGLAEWQEYLAVVVAGGASAGLLFAWVSLAAGHRGRGARERSATTPSVVFDREIDRLPGREGKPRCRAKSSG